jgi:lipoprotein-releasing system ATP-binding protein
MSDTPSGAASTVLSCRGLTKSFEEGAQRLEVLRGIDMDIARSERLAIVGASGSGKTTLLQLLGGLDAPTSGSVSILGEDLSGLSEDQRGRLRNRAIGFVYQFHHLLPEFSALENVAMPLLVRREPVRAAADAAADLLSKVGLGERLTHRPAQLSGGERQRAAVARALITRPALVLADEPTGNLDRRIGEQVFDVMLDLNRELGTSLVVVTHDEAIAARMDRVLSLQDGRLTPGSPHLPD